MQDFQIAAAVARIENLKRAVAFFERDRQRLARLGATAEILESNARVLAELRRTLELCESTLSPGAASENKQPGKGDGRATSGAPSAAGASSPPGPAINPRCSPGTSAAQPPGGSASQGEK